MCVEPAELHVFLSHVASLDGQLVATVATVLEEQGISCFYSGRDIPDSTQWMHVIETALLRCDALVAFVRDEYKSSDWTDQELGFALGRRRPVITVMMVPNWRPYGFISEIQAITGETCASGIAARIYAALWNHDAHRPVLTRLLLNSLHTSRNRNDLKATIKRLRSVKLAEPFTSCAAAAMTSNPVIHSDPRLRRLLLPLLGAEVG